MSLNILHANPNILMANGLKAVLSRGGGVDSIINCDKEELLFSKLADKRFDLIILDPDCPGHFSTDTVNQIKSQFPNQKVLVISSTHNQKRVLQVLERGVQGFLTRECDEDEIIHAVFSIAKGEKFYCNKVLDIILNKQFAEEEDCAPTVLSERENEIVALVARGMTNKEIGDELCLSHHTIHTHRRNILKKLGINNVSELTLYAINVGLIEA